MSFSIKKMFKTIYAYLYLFLGKIFSNNFIYLNIFLILHITHKSKVTISDHMKHIKAIIS